MNTFKKKEVKKDGVKPANCGKCNGKSSILGLMGDIYFMACLDCDNKYWGGFRSMERATKYWNDLQIKMDKQHEDI